MINTFTFNGVDYEIKGHVNKHDETTSFKQIFRCDGQEIANETQLLKEYLINKGYSPVQVNLEKGNLRLAGYVFKVINGKPINIRKADESYDVAETTDEQANTIENNNHDISKLAPMEFYEYANNFVREYACIAGVENIDKYFDMTDYYDGSVYKRLYNLNLNDEQNKIKYLFAQFAYHATNVTYSPFYGFDEKVAERKAVFCGFDVDSFLSKYQDMNSQDRYNCFIALAKSSTENAINRVKAYVQLMVNVAKYLQGKTRKAVIDEIIAKTPETNPVNGIDFVINTIMKDGNKNSKLFIGFALTCDILKELDPYFSFLCKPDLHIKQILGKYSNKVFKDTKNGNKECLKTFADIVSKIKESDSTVTGYKLDRMLYLIGSGFFFLDPVQRYTHHNNKKLEFMSRL